MENPSSTAAETGAECEPSLKLGTSVVWSPSGPQALALLLSTL